MSVTVAPVTQADWEAFVAQRPEANFLNAWQWGQLHEALGDRVVRRSLSRDGKIVGVLLGIVKDARRGRYLELPGSPLLDWEDDELVQAAIAELRAIGRSERCVFIRARPQLLDSPTHRKILRAVGFKQAPMHLHAEHTNILDIQPDNDHLLAAMRRQTRYEIKKAAKQGVAVSVSASKKALDEFYRVQADTARRQGFIPPSQTFLRAQQQAFGSSLRIYRAEKEGVLLALGLVIFYGQEAVYHEAASTPEGRNQPGAYAIQWQVIQDARAAGLSRYNFWGIAYSTDPKHRYAGVTTFKRGFGGQDVTFVPAHDLVLGHIGYAKNWLIETIRKKLRRL